MNNEETIDFHRSLSYMTQNRILSSIYDHNNKAEASTYIKQNIQTVLSAGVRNSYGVYYNV